MTEQKHSVKFTIFQRQMQQESAYFARFCGGDLLGFRHRIVMFPNNENRVVAPLLGQDGL